MADLSLKIITVAGSLYMLGFTGIVVICFILTDSCWDELQPINYYLTQTFVYLLCLPLFAFLTSYMVTEGQVHRFVNFAYHKQTDSEFRRQLNNADVESQALLSLNRHDYYHSSYYHSSHYDGSLHPVSINYKGYLLLLIWLVGSVGIMVLIVAYDVVNRQLLSEVVEACPKYLIFHIGKYCLFVLGLVAGHKVFLLLKPSSLKSIPSYSA